MSAASPITAGAATASMDAFQQAFLEANRKTEVSQAPKNTDTKIEEWMSQYRAYVGLSDLSNAFILAEPLANRHVVETRKAILDGAKHLNKGQSVVVVLEPKIVGKEDEPFEPLNELVKKCKKLILIGSNQTNLNKLSTKLGSTKVSIIHVDWSGGLYEDLIKLGANLEAEGVNYSTRAKFRKQHTEVYDASKALAVKSALIDKIGRGTVDYVVSSSVPHEAYMWSFETLDFLYQKLFRGIKKEIKCVKEGYTNPGIIEERYNEESMRFPEEIPAAQQRYRSVYYSLIAANIDLSLSIVRSKSGKIYFTDTTKVIKKLGNSLQVKMVHPFEDVRAQIQALKDCEKTSFWVWNFNKGKDSNKVEHWLWRNIPKNAKFLEESDKKNEDAVVLSNKPSVTPPTAPAAAGAASMPKEKTKGGGT